MSARDLPDLAVLREVQRQVIEQPFGAPWATSWQVIQAFPEHPPKVVIAKLRKLVRRGLLTGHAHIRERGDFELTDRGRWLLALDGTLGLEPGDLVRVGPDPRAGYDELPPPDWDGVLRPRMKPE